MTENSEDYIEIDPNIIYSLAGITDGVGSKITDEGATPGILYVFKGIHIDKPDIEIAFAIDVRDLPQFAEYIAETSAEFLKKHGKKDG